MYLDGFDASINILHLYPEWEEPCKVFPSTNFVQFGDGDDAKFRVNIKNEYDYNQYAALYIWLVTPQDLMFFFDGFGLTPEIFGIPLDIPANTDISADILTFTMPEGVPEGYYNINAVFIDEDFNRGPVGTWNFYVKD